MLVSVPVYAFCFQVPCWVLYSPIGAQLLAFAPLQTFGAYPWQAYVEPSDGHQLTPGIHQVAALSTALSKRELSATQSAVQLNGGAYCF